MLAEGFLEVFRAGFRALFGAVFFFATAFRAIGRAALAFTLAFDLVFAATLEVARFAVFFAADLAVIFAADFLLFFFPAGFAIPTLLLVALLFAVSHSTARVLSYIPESFSTTINSVNRKIARTGAILLLIAVLTSCSGLSSLTPDILDQAEAKWRASEPAAYHLLIEMKGDRVEKEVFDVTVRDGQLTTLRRNGRDIQPTPEKDYSMDGLFRVLHQEMALAQKPTLLGAPEGYSAYPMARFDSQTGRLIEYRRTVGGTSNTIDIRVLEFKLL